MKNFITRIARQCITTLAFSGVLTFGSLAAMPVAAHALNVPSPTSSFAACPTLGSLHSYDKPAGSGQGANCFVKKYVNPFIKFFASVIGVFIVISLVMGGIQYSTSADDPNKVTAAKKRIFNSLLALLAFFVLASFFQYLVPDDLRK